MRPTRLSKISHPKSRSQRNNPLQVIYWKEPPELPASKAVSNAPIGLTLFRDFRLCPGYARQAHPKNYGKLKELPRNVDYCLCGRFSLSTAATAYNHSLRCCPSASLANLFLFCKPCVPIRSAWVCFRAVPPDAVRLGDLFRISCDLSVRNSFLGFGMAV